MAGPSVIRHVRPIIGLEVHVELATASKLFSPAPNPAHVSAPSGHAPNTLVDEIVLALPGALPVLNRHAVVLATRLGLALGCTINPRMRFDRKSYFYPDNPKAYQISQFDFPLCGSGLLHLPAADDRGMPDPARPWIAVRIARAHIEEDAGKLLHERPGGGALDHSIVDYNRAGTPLLEIVTEPDLSSPGDVVLLARLIRAAARTVSATLGVLEQGHIRFEPNINCELTLDSGRLVRTPIVEVKNLNSFKSLRGAVEFEIADQPRRWLEDGIEHGPGRKTTRGYDDDRAITLPQRSKEDALDYRYFEDPDLPQVDIPRAFVADIAATLPELPTSRWKRYVETFGIPPTESWSIVEEPADAHLLDAAAAALAALGLDHARAGKLAANALLGVLARLARASGTTAGRLGLTPPTLARVLHLREQGELSPQNADALLEHIIAHPEHASNPSLDIAALADALSLRTVRDDAALSRAVEETLAQHGSIVDQIKSGKTQALGRLIGEAMKRAQGKADARAVRAALLSRLGLHDPAQGQP